MAHPLYFSDGLRKIEAAHAALPLMQRAGAAAAAAASRLCMPAQLPILILAGPGNNGGDAFEAALGLQRRYHEVVVVFAGTPNKQPEAVAAMARFQAAGGCWHPDIPSRPRWGLIIDGLFGIGLRDAPRAPYDAWITLANQLARRDACPVLALDCPSGLDADTGQAHPPALLATHTLSFIAHKPGLFTLDGPDHCGEIDQADLAIAPGLPPDGHLLERRDFAASLPQRKRNSHKGSHGTAGIWGGNTGMLGAALLAGRAALQCGSGKAVLRLLAADAPAVDLAQPELMLHPASAPPPSPPDALACGPGMGMDEAARRMLEEAIASPLPLVLDADALTLLACDSVAQARLGKRPAPTILTPHPAEAARLLGTSTADIQAQRIDSAQQLAGRFQAWVALKGCGTLIAQPDGHWWINTTGNAGLASAGSGDVLTGIIVAFLAQGMPAAAALQAAVCLHGAAAGHLVDTGSGPIGLTAGELIPAARHLLNQWVAALR